MTGTGTAATLWRGLLTLALALPLVAATTADPAGAWRGTVVSPHGEIPVVFELERGQALWEGRAAIGGSLEDASEMPEVQVRGDSVFLGITLPTNLGGATMRMRGVQVGDTLSGDFVTTTPDGDRLGEGTWRAVREAAAG